MNLEIIAKDTTPEASRVQLEILRRLPPGRRMELALEMSDVLRSVLADGVRLRHPGYSPEEVRLAVFRILQGDELFHTVYPGVEIAV
jgi:hypothetical protein